MVCTSALRRIASVALLGAALPACASQPAPERAERGGRAVLHATEMQATGYADLYQVVQTLRPEWLRPQGAATFSGAERIQVYLDGSRLGGVDQLRSITTRSVASAQFLTALEATQRWGLDHGLGAIVISTR